TLKRTLGSAPALTTFRSAENTALKEVDAGSKGAQVTLTFAAAVPALHTMEIWRRDEGVGARYHLVGTAAAAATTFADTVSDVSDGVILHEGRCAPPQGATCVFAHKGRVGVAAPGFVWLSALADPTGF